MTDAILSLTDARLTLTSHAGRVDILHGITLSVAAGETLALTGPSGSGKSSLLMLMGGLERATGGSVRALGADLSAMSEDALARFRRDHMGVVFQSFHLIPTLTAVENVAVPLELAGRVDAFDAAAAELEAVGLGHRMRHYPAELSGGEQQRVAVARAAAPRPEILLADEPTGNLDAANGAAVMELILGLRERHGSTLVLVTHAPELAARCDRVVRLSDGRVAGDETRDAAATGADMGGKAAVPRADLRGKAAATRAGLRGKAAE
ncbi:ATP-binding cassette domain-containing protein [Rhodobacterales bacterium HKCCE2091]|nr:ATP-binding cassette domain-containing protein [Rhodobacterales bacterium HKCCE2091]